MMPRAPFILLEDSLAGQSLLFAAPSEIITAASAAEVPEAFSRLEAAHKAGRWIAGFAAYELGLVLEPKLAGLLGAGHGPLMQFGVFDAPVAETLPAGGSGRVTALSPDWTEADYAPRFDKVSAYIAAGDVYQINLTFPMRGQLEGDVPGLYAALKKRQPVAHGAVVCLSDETIVSLSPELFFETKGSRITARPMKGTAPRGADAAADEAIKLWLSRDEKQRAENLMIVDLLRNDLSRISQVGSVKVPELFAVETYNTLHQMTSTVTAQLRPGLTLQDLFTGLFPCGSVTGAPKIRAMEIIAELEAAPRGVYCGSIGHIAPSGDVAFNVAIRTLTIAADGSVVVNVGSGTVADSTASEEYAECLLKSRFLNII
jgi:para-aminobenzoate synthetase component I